MSVPAPLFDITDDSEQQRRFRIVRNGRRDEVWAVLESVLNPAILLDWHRKISCEEPRGHLWRTDLIRARHDRLVMGGQVTKQPGN